MLGRERRRIHLGKYPSVTLADARKRARELILCPRASLSGTTLRETFADYFSASVQPNYKPRSAREVQRLFATHLAPLADRPLSSFTPADLSKLINGLSETPSQANYVYSLLKCVFRYAEERNLIPASPLTFRRPFKSGERDRLLSDQELKAIYRAATEIGYPFGYIVLICVHTGMRRSEVAHLKWEYITANFINMPAHLCKNGHAYSIPNLIYTELQNIPRTSEYLFASERDIIFNDWGRQKRKLDRICGVSDWVIHDTRRYFSSTLASLDVSIETIERLLNHVSGSQTPLAKIYNRYKYYPQMRAALERYEQKLAQLLKR
jgi:integrase